MIAYIFNLARLSTALRKVTIAKRNFHPSGLFDDWGNGARRLLTVEKEEASTLLAADLATTVAEMFYKIILPARPIIVLYCIRFIQPLKVRIILKIKVNVYSIS